MKRQTLKFDDCVIESILVDNIIYLKTSGIYTDNAAIKMTKYLDDVFSQIPSPPIRIWDSTDLPSECFKLSKECVKKIVDWSNKIKIMKPGSQSYFIAPKPLIFGVSRMYELQASDDKMDVKVLRKMDELPKKIREKIPYSRNGIASWLNEYNTDLIDMNL